MESLYLEKGQGGIASFGENQMGLGRDTKQGKLILSSQAKKDSKLTSETTTKESVQCTNA